MAGNVGSTIVPEGIFIAPDSAFNRWLHRLLANVRPGVRLPRLPRGAPATRSRGDGFQLLAHLEPVAPATMLGTLEGWSEAGRLAALDGRRLAAAELTLAERYWRLGAGLYGAPADLLPPRPRPTPGRLGRHAGAQATRAPRAAGQRRGRSSARWPASSSSAAHNGHAKRKSCAVLSASAPGSAMPRQPAWRSKPASLPVSCAANTARWRPATGSASPRPRGNSTRKGRPTGKSSPR